MAFNTGDTIPVIADVGTIENFEEKILKSTWRVIDTGTLLAAAAGYTVPQVLALDSSTGKYAPYDSGGANNLDIPLGILMDYVPAVASGEEQDQFVRILIAGVVDESEIEAEGVAITNAVKEAMQLRGRTAIVWR